MGRVLLALEATGLLAQDVDPGGTTLNDYYIGFSEMILLVMLWRVRNLWPAGASFTFNCYRHWAQIFLRQPGNAPVILMSREGVTKGETLLMVLYDITLVLLAEELRDTNPTLFSTFYPDDAEFDGLAWRSAAQLRLLIDWDQDRGYFPEPAKLIFIVDNPEENEAEKR